MILRSRGAKAPLLSVDLMPVSVGLIPREGGLLSPCRWTCGCEIYKMCDLFEIVLLTVFGKIEIEQKGSRM